MKVEEAIAKRWSPRAFSEKQINKSDLIKIFKAGGTAPSAFNEQPWRYIVGAKGSENYDKILSVLVEFNQEWCKTAPVLAIGVGSKKFKRNQNDNDYALHDLGAASAYLTMQAMEMDIYVHQMAGFSPEKAVKEFGIPEDYQAATVLAIGYLGDKNILSEELRNMETPESPRMELNEFLFDQSWEKSTF